MGQLVQLLNVSVQPQCLKHDTHLKRDTHLR